jgi:hypothetical protein
MSRKHTDREKGRTGEREKKPSAASPSNSPPAIEHSPRRFWHFVRLLLLVLVSIAAGGWFAYTHRQQPPSVYRILFQGVTYRREVRQKPVPCVIHVVTVQLDDPKVSLLVTPGDPKAPRPLRAMKTSQFLAKHQLQVAINGDFFFPWWSKSPWNYYPHIGDPVELQGLAASRGTLYSTGGERWKFPILVFDRNNIGHFEKNHTLRSFYNIISGIYMIVENGSFALPRRSIYLTDRQPRTVIALDRSGRQLILCVIDGRQPNYSEGATIEETAQIVRKYGGHNALNLDGGGSSTLVIEGDDGKPLILNCPIDNRIPGRERPIANHFGVFAGKRFR